MKKILLIAALFISIGVVSSCTKENVTPSIRKPIADTEMNGDNLGQADGGIDRPKRPHAAAE